MLTRVLFDFINGEQGNEPIPADNAPTRDFEARTRCSQMIPRLADAPVTRTCRLLPLRDG